MADGVGAFLKAVQELRGERAAVPPINLGVVVSVAPLSVRVGQLTIPRAALKVDPMCVYEPKPSEPPNPHKLDPGDEVLLVTGDGQSFVAVCKVVSG